MVLPGRRPLTATGTAARRPQPVLPGQMTQQNMQQGPAQQRLGAPQIGADVASGLNRGTTPPGQTPASGQLPHQQNLQTSGGTTPGYRYTGEGAWQTTSQGPEAGGGIRPMSPYAGARQAPSPVSPQPVANQMAPGANKVANLGMHQTSASYGAGALNQYGVPNSPTTPAPAGQFAPGTYNPYDYGNIQRNGGGSATGSSSSGLRPTVAGDYAKATAQAGGLGGAQAPLDQGQPPASSEASGYNPYDYENIQRNQQTQSSSGGVATSSSGLRSGENGLPEGPDTEGVNLVAAPNDKDSGSRTTEDGRILRTGDDGNDYAWNEQTGEWDPYTNVRGFDPATGDPYAGYISEQWDAANPGKAPRAGDSTQVQTGPGEYRYYRSDGKGNWLETNENGAPLGGGSTPGQGQSSQRAPDGWTINSDGSWTDDFGRTFASNSPEVTNAIAGQKEKDAFAAMGGPGGLESGVTDADIEQKLTADRRQRAYDTSKAVRLAMELGEGGAPEAQAASVAGAQQQANVAGAAQEAQTNLEYQKMQTEANLANYQMELQKTLAIMQSAQTREGRAQAESSARQLQAIINQHQEKMLRLNHELSKPSVGEIIGGAFGSVLGGVGGGLGQLIGGKIA